VSLRVSCFCDHPDCANFFTSPPFAWGQGLEPFLRELTSHGWSVDLERRLFCAEHRATPTAPPAPAPPTDPLSNEMGAETYAGEPRPSERGAPHAAELCSCTHRRVDHAYSIWPQGGPCLSSGCRCTAFFSARPPDPR
jgi:hypothetical protein